MDNTASTSASRGLCEMITYSIAAEALADKFYDDSFNWNAVEETYDGFISPIELSMFACWYFGGCEHRLDQWDLSKGLHTIAALARDKKQSMPNPLRVRNVTLGRLMPLPFGGLEAATHWHRWIESSCAETVATDDKQLWEGFYTYLTLPPDPPMENVRFTFHHGTGASDSICGTGVDSVGQFHFRDFAWGNSPGEFSTVKEYPGSHSWLYRGVVTPFGLVGSWHQQHLDRRFPHLYRQNSAGDFYLWKKAWMADTPLSRAVRT